LKSDTKLIGRQELLRYEQKKSADGASVSDKIKHRLLSGVEDI